MDPLTAEDHRRLDLRRLQRTQAALIEAGCVAALLLNQLNLRYATGTARSTLYNQHEPTRYGFVPAAGPATLFDNMSARQHHGDKAAVGDYRPSAMPNYWVDGPRFEEKAGRCAAEVAALLRAAAGDGNRLAVDRLDPALAAALEREGLTLVAAGPIVEQARAVKTPEEVTLLRGSMAVCDGAVAVLRDNLVPGITERELWSRLYGAGLGGGGLWQETRLLSSGPRTNPWYQEVSDRVIEAGDLTAVDTDMVGPFGYLSDISRTLLCGDAKPSGEQRELYGLAYEQLQHNLALIRPGATTREVMENAWVIRERFRKNRYLAVAHGAGMCNEYPNICFPDQWDSAGYEATLEENMVICIGSYLGAEGGREGVKLEEQVLVTANGSEVLSKTGYDERLLA